MDSAKAVDFAIQLAAILFAISFHESAHAWMAFRWGDSTAKDLGRISMNPIRHIDLIGSILLPILLYFTAGMVFAYAKPTPVRLENTRDPRRADRWISGAGPLSNFLLAIVGVILLFGLVAALPPTRAADSGLRGSIVTPLVVMLWSFVGVNVALGLFNLLPLPPLDGSWVFSSIFGGSVRRAFEAIAPFGFFILIVLSGTGILRRVMTPPYFFIMGTFRRLLGFE